MHSKQRQSLSAHAACVPSDSGHVKSYAGLLYAAATALHRKIFAWA